MRRLTKATITLALVLACATSTAETKNEYGNRFRIMLDFAVRSNEYLRQHLGDSGLAAYVHAMAERNATEAERMTPPAAYAVMHPHFLLVLENIERSFFFASQKEMSKYRHHQKIVRKELQLLEAMAEREHMDLYLWMRCA